MNNIELKYFIDIAKEVLKSFNVLPTDEKELKQIEDSLCDLSNYIYTYNTWSNQRHINSSFIHITKKSKKTINSYIKTQITHLDASMELCRYQFSSLDSYFHLYTLKALFIFFLNNENDLINKLHDAKFRSLTEPKYFNNPYKLLEDIFGKNPFKFDQLIDNFNFQESYVSEYKRNFANNIIKMYKFFDAFNMTEKKMKTNFAIDIYNEFKILNFEKVNTKEIVDTIMYCLSINASIKDKNIENIYYIGTIYVNHIYSFTKPTIHTKLVDRNLIQKIQKEKRELALKNKNLEELAILDNMIQSTNSSFTL